MNNYDLHGRKNDALRIFSPYFSSNIYRYNTKQSAFK